MNTSRQPSHDAVAARQLDLLIEENLGARSAPDVADRVMKALSQPTHQPATRRWRGWLQVACALLGLGVVVTIGTATADAPRVVMQQPVLGPEVTVTSIAAIERLPISTDNVRLKVYTADAVRALTRLPKLRRLDASFDAPVTSHPREVARPAFFPDAAGSLGMLTTLEQLDISGHAPIRGLEQLATLSRLRSLRIYHALIDPTCLSVLAKLPKLEDLALEVNQTLDEEAPLIDLRDPNYGLLTFASSGKLRSLTITTCIADAAGMRAIAKNPLERLEIYRLSSRQPTRGKHNALQASAYVPIGTIATLRELCFQDSASPELFAELRQLQHLTDLDIGGADGLEGKAIGVAIASLPHVRKLSVSGSDIDTDALMELTKAQGLVDLALGGDAGCTNEVLAKVCQLPALRRLTMPIVPGFTNAGMAPLKDTSLDYLRLMWAKDIKPEGLMHLPPMLLEVEVEGHMLDAAVFEHLGSVASWSIEFDSRLRIPLLKCLYDSAVRENLEVLKLGGDLNMLESLALLAKFPKLREVDLQRSSGIVPRDVVQMLRDKGMVVTEAPPRTGEPGEELVIEVVEVAVEKPGGGK